MFSQHLLRATSLNTTQSLLRPYDGSILRPERSTISQMTFNDQDREFQAKLEITQQEHHDHIISTIAQFKAEIAAQLATITSSLTDLDRRVKTLETTQQSTQYHQIPLLPQPQLPHQLSTRSDSFTTSLTLTPSPDVLKRFYQSVGQQVYRAATTAAIAPQELYAHFASISQQVYDFANDIPRIASKLNLSLHSANLQSAYDQVYGQIQAEILYFVAQTFDFPLLFTQISVPFALEGAWKDVFHCQPKVGETYSLSVIFGAVALIFALKYRAQPLQFSECSGTLGEFQRKFGIKSDKDRGSMCQIVLPQWTGGIQIPAYVKLVK
ncbi:hypothetical protein SS50377_24009 [Spironucleus salmonicida]|uniref:Uncharacterized protein n=1 Tax=Spironucleus salmonicida TaxID=348837 RepID=V6LQ60_9EUKA|nr:hypothetical protein SS50377_24009 [Spironucleus salmonicida]|eukprot:EST42894.1 Hypothetical protein SS50377_17427 [Spironucleus salmonicida]